MPRLASKVATITGVGAGIGEAIAIRFAEEGASLVLNDISAAAGQAAVKKIRDMGTEATLAVADISQEASARAISETAVKSFGGIDILVNNAGVTRDGRSTREKKVTG